MGGRARTGAGHAAGCRDEGFAACLGAGHNGLWSLTIKPRTSASHRTSLSGSRRIVGSNPDWGATFPTY